MCLYPKLIINPKYKANKKNNWRPPKLEDERIKYVPIACGKCIECKKKKSREWQIRLTEEIKRNKSGKFVTLTFNDEELRKLEEITKKENKNTRGYQLENLTATKGVRRFLERWRKTHKKSIKHWLITELGHKNSERIHLHGIIFTDEEEEEIRQKWKYGKIWIGEYVNNKTINYIIKYITKTDKDHKNYNSKILTSPGIGGGYEETQNAKNNKYKGEKTKEEYRTREGIKLNMPIYYRNKIYTETEREELWINKIEKKERYVLGMKIDVSTEKGINTYQIAVQNAREKNKRLGYGNDEKDYNQINYENDMREILRLKRKRKLEK